MDVVVIKALISVACAGLGWLLYRFWHPFLSRPFGHTSAVVLALFFLRLVPFAIVYLALGLQPRSDVSMFWTQAIKAAQGGLVYRDFASVYGPLFPYLLALPTLLWRDPRVLVLLMIVVEICALLLTLRLLSSRLYKDQLVLASLLYLIQPAPLLFIVLGGQEDVWLWGFGALIGWLLVTRGKFFHAGVVAGAGLLAAKALLVAALIPTMLVVRKRWSFACGIGCVVLAAYFPLWFLAGKSALMPLGEAAGISPPSVWFVLNALFGRLFSIGSPGLAFAGLTLAIASACLFFWRFRKSIAVSVVAYAAGWIMAFISVILLTPKALTTYTCIFLMPLTFLVVAHGSSRAVALLLLLSAAAAVHPSLWFRLGQPVHSAFSFVNSKGYLVEFLLEIVIMGALIAVLLQVWRWSSAEASLLKRRQPGAGPSAGDRTG